MRVTRLDKAEGAAKPPGLRRLLRVLELRSGAGERERGNETGSKPPPGPFGLRRLDLSRALNGLGEKGACALGDMVKSNYVLQALDLSLNLLLAERLEPLLGALGSHNHALLELNLAGNAFGNEGVDALADALQQNEKLERIDCSSCQIDSEKKGIKLHHALASNNTLLECGLKDNRLGEGNVQHIYEHLMTNQQLKNKGSTDGFVRPDNALQKLASSHKITKRDGVVMLRSIFNREVKSKTEQLIAGKRQRHASLSAHRLADELGSSSFHQELEGGAAMKGTGPRPRERAPEPRDPRHAARAARGAQPGDNRSGAPRPKAICEHTGRSVCDRAYRSRRRCVRPERWCGERPRASADRAAAPLRRLVDRAGAASKTTVVGARERGQSR